MTEFEEGVRILQRSRPEQPPQTIVITGCNSGIGLYACKLIRSVSPESHLYLVARNINKAAAAKKEILSCLESESYSDDRITPMACDHTSLCSVYRFCEDLKQKLHPDERDGSGRQPQKGGIDVLCLNAAILLGEDAKTQYTEDNIEVTFQTNHLAPFLIANLTFELMNPGGRVVVTTSGLHTFASFGEFSGMMDSQTGRIRKGFEMVDDSTFDYKKSYAASKLCNVAFCLGLNKRLQKRGAIAVCFTPGLIPSSGLFRHQTRWDETVLKKRAVGMGETEEWGGSILAWMALVEEVGKEGGVYWRAPFGISKRGGTIPGDLFREPINDEAKDIDNIEQLWRLSMELTGLRNDRM